MNRLFPYDYAEDNGNQKRSVLYKYCDSQMAAVHCDSHARDGHYEEDAERKCDQVSFGSQWISAAEYCHDQSDDSC